MVIWKTFLGYPLKTISNKKLDLVELPSNPYLRATSRGVELVNNDSLTKAKAELYEEVKEVESPLKSYEEGIREMVVKGEITLPKITTDYTIIEDEVLMTKNNTQQFLRTPIANYELVFQEGNLSFFKEITGVEKNLTDVDFTKYINEATKPENYIKAKPYYSKKELQEINNNYFSCQ